MGGCRAFPEEVIPLFVTDLIDGKTVPPYGDGGLEPAVRRYREYEAWRRLLEEKAALR